jgi:hypothetical protein
MRDFASELLKRRVHLGPDYRSTLDYDGLLALIARLLIYKHNENDDSKNDHAYMLGENEFISKIYAGLISDADIFELCLELSCGVLQCIFDPEVADNSFFTEVMSAGYIDFESLRKGFAIAMQLAKNTEQYAPQQLEKSYDAKTFTLTIDFASMDPSRPVHLYSLEDFLYLPPTIYDIKIVGLQSSPQHLSVLLDVCKILEKAFKQFSLYNLHAEMDLGRSDIVTVMLNNITHLHRNLVKNNDGVSLVNNLCDIYPQLQNNIMGLQLEKQTLCTFYRQVVTGKLLLSDFDNYPDSEGESVVQASDLSSKLKLKRRI